MISNWVSREEMNERQAKKYFSLYGLKLDVKNALHSAPLEQCFLPEKAAHVINISQEI